MSTYFEVVEGLRLPARLSGHPVLDFCNTWAGWDGRATKEYLDSYDHLAVWAGFVELLPAERVAILLHQAERRPRAADAVLAKARRYRDAVYAVLSGEASARTFELVAREVHAAAASRRLRRAYQSVSWELAPATGLAMPLAAVAWSAGELLTSSSVQRVRACPGAGCGWLFLDRSGRRRWCTMATCGNREKARRFATRQRAALPRSTGGRFDGSRSLDGWVSQPR